MRTLTLNSRLRLYLNYGVAGFIIIFFLLQEVHEELMLFFPLLFNLGLIIIFVSKVKSDKKGLILTGTATWVLTTLIFWIQYQYRNLINAGHIQIISDWPANVSYALTLVLFSIIGWEMGFWILKK